MGKKIKYIVVKKNNKEYKVFLSDIKKIFTKQREKRPPVPPYKDEPVIV